MEWSGKLSTAKPCTSNEPVFSKNCGCDYNKDLYKKLFHFKQRNNTLIIFIREINIKKHIINTHNFCSTFIIKYFNNYLALYLFFIHYFPI